MKQISNINIIVIFLSFLMIILSITSIELPWQHLIAIQLSFGFEYSSIIVDRELFDSGYYYSISKKEWIEISTNSITNGIMACMGINILSLVVIFMNPFKRFFKFISDSHYLFIEKILIRSLSVMIVIFYASSITIGLMLSAFYCQQQPNNDIELQDTHCFTLSMFSTPIMNDWNFIQTSTLSSKPMKGWYLSIWLFVLSIILTVIVFIRFNRISSQLVNLGYRDFLTNNKWTPTSSITNDNVSEAHNLSSNESDNIASVEVEPLISN
ncbi:hypothetical protein RB653_009243 [Dictyostelium firmibasis]|uniref:Transmembrane protein n=1 Tax=Dictyostelium firmibasis TaxID=79012 RepID=A0AAN7YPZ2_9MYCE